MNFSVSSIEFFEFQEKTNTDFELVQMYENVITKFIATVTYILTQTFGNALWFGIGRLKSKMCTVTEF